ncbi:uncharacterized protein LOC111081970 [Drosophila obscura]|uniref:uncharacterized protein LOC111081970 n=1 Tax=Drosophila obscura TaxID=7282 RepID=UPI000BA17421|nr:uncharacterized protein LOC111081970 [Drosophila obscura]
MFKMHRLQSLHLTSIKGDLFEIIADVPAGPSVGIFLNENPRLVQRYYIQFEIQPLNGTMLRLLTGQIVKETAGRDLVLRDCEASIIIGYTIYNCFMGLVRLPVSNIISTY